MDGVELIRRLARRRCRAGLVLLSGIDNDLLSSICTMASDYGVQCIETLEKPVSRPQLEALLARLMSGTTAVAGASEAMAAPPGLDEVDSALQRGQLQPWFQPQIDAGSGTIVAAEALVRWVLPQRGVLLPSQFLPQISRLGQQALLTVQMLNGALRAAAAWRRLGHQIAVSVNVDAQELGDTQFADRVLGFLETYGLPAQQLTIEVVESNAFTSLGAALDCLSRLRLYGVQVSIDDFGTGYNSLAQLMVSPYTELKIDRSFVARMGRCDRHRAVVRLCANFARDMGYRVVAEGVEDEQTARELAEIGCDLQQGFFYSPAVSAEDFTAFLAPCQPSGRDHSGHHRGGAIVRTGRHGCGAAGWRLLADAAPS